ncbi:MAG: PPC domain-containing protein [Synechococcales cyanobacterium C42_A2020_086]|jgi:hypothetical protein|nr:PPC domain-containing protein [Synechococcales cyanobacterium C42_A2020_086]
MADVRSPFTGSLPTQGRGIFRDIRRSLERENPVKDIRVRFAARSSLLATLGGMGPNRNIDLELLDSNRETVLAFSRRIGNRPERIEINNLAPDTYYLRASLKRGRRSRFRLQIATTPLVDTGNTPSRARFVSLSSEPTTLTEFVGAEDRSDFYAFTLGAPGFPSNRLTVSLTGVDGHLLGGNVSVRLRDGLLNPVGTPRQTRGQGGLQFTEPLAAGTYFLEIAPADPKRDQATYRLTLTNTAIFDSAGNTPAAARPITLNETPSLFREFIGIGDQTDYYQVTLPKSTFNLTLTGPNGNLLRGPITVRLRDQLNTVIETRTTLENGGGTTIVNRPLDAGTYFIQLSTSNRDVDYGLLMSATPAAVPPAEA